MRFDDWEPEHLAWSSADIRHLEVLSSKLVTSIFAGEYRSVFRGRGIEFEDVREYQPGDDVRSIDWNVTARAGRPFVKQFVEEREMTVILLLDVSPSLRSMTAHGRKSRVAAEIVALLTFAAARSNDRIGLLTFTDRVECFIPPAKGRRHAQRLIAEGLQQPPAGRGTDLAGALNYLNRVQRRGAILFLISDFQANGYRLPLAAAARRHDVVAVAVTDSMDYQLPAVGLVEVTDAETGSRRLIDTGNAMVITAYGQHAAQSRAALKQTFAAAGVEYLAVDTGSAPVQSLVRFFLGRQRRLSRRQ